MAEDASRDFEDAFRERVSPPSTAGDDPSQTQQPRDQGHGASAPNSKEVTDPVTHLPITVHDSTAEELERIPPPPRTPPKQPSDESARAAETKKRHDEMQRLVDEEARSNWHNPEEGKRRETAYRAVVAGGSGGVGALIGLIWLMGISRRSGAGLGWVDFITGLTGWVALGAGLGLGVFSSLRCGKKAEAEAGAGAEASLLADGQQASYGTMQSWSSNSKAPESAAWLNAFLASVWPLVNPALFVSLADTLEDVMQASLPKLISGVRVADLGQGSEPLRFLGIRWLEAGDAAVSKGSDMGAEEGDFVNLELAVAYRGRPTGHGLKSRSRNAHLLMEFFSVGGVKLPVWVQITGILTTARVRLQLTPDPPFVSLMTLTLLGKPKVTMSCVPLAKNFLNVMDIPGVSNFIQNCIDEAVSAYVAPRSLTLNLQELLMGPDFKYDTQAHGVVVVRVIRAEGFKDGDAGKVWLDGEGKHGDPYVTVGWGKWGKAIWATRIIQDENEPVWDETTALLVTPAEVNAKERLRLQLWDSDRTTADDFLGQVDVSLQELMSPEGTMLNQITPREDRFTDSDSRPLPGTLYWSVGYFSKTRLQAHLSEEEISNIERQAAEAADAKLSEAQGTNEAAEREQERKEEIKERTDKIIATRAPNPEWPSGILSVQIHNIVGLEIENIQASGVKEEGEDEESDDLPSAYCSVIVNHQKVYKTRTKLKTNKPFFNAGTERFIRDWRTAEVLICAWDSRLRENDPVIGVVRLPLHETFKGCSLLNDTFPLVGGVGHGRIRISMVFRSVQVQLPPELLGWDLGTLEIAPSATMNLDPAARQDRSSDLAACRLVLRTPYGKGKLHPASACPDPRWETKRSRPIRVPIKKRYATSLTIAFRKHSLGPDQTPAFAVLWLKDIVDEQDLRLSLPIYRTPSKGDVLEKVAANVPDEKMLAQLKQVGTLHLRVRFWAGLGGYHAKLAERDANMKDVMGALDCAEDSEVADGDSQKKQLEDYVTSSSSGESESDIEEDERLRNEGRRGLVDQAREYKRNRKEIERKHRGIMQWKGVRNLAWAKDRVEGKVDGGRDAFLGRFRHKEREERVDTEV